MSLPGIQAENLELVQMLLSQNKTIDHVAELMSEGNTAYDTTRSYWTQRIIEAVEDGILII